MATIVTDCPRCGARLMTMDILADVFIGSRYDWQHCHEVTARCRRCHRPSLLLVALQKARRKTDFGKDGSITAAQGDIAGLFSCERPITVAELAAKASPEHIPENIAHAFIEGTRCLAIGCHNAAAAMFRLCLDLATKSMLPDPADEGAPNGHQRRNLAPRLTWLFEKKLLPSDLQDLSTAVKDDGNDGAHDGTLSEDDADDLYDFAFALLERLYTHPARLAAAKERRDARKPVRGKAAPSC